MNLFKTVEKIDSKIKFLLRGFLNMNDLNTYFFMEDLLFYDYDYDYNYNYKHNNNNGNDKEGILFYIMLLFMTYMFLDSIERYLIDYFYIFVISSIILTIKLPYFIKKDKISPKRVKILKRLNCIIGFIVVYSTYLVLDLNGGFVMSILNKVILPWTLSYDGPMKFIIFFNLIVPFVFAPISLIIDTIIIPIFGVPFIQRIIWSRIPYFINLKNESLKIKVKSNNRSTLKLIVKCPECKSKYKVPENIGEIIVTCVQCNHRFRCNTNISKNKKYKKNSDEIQILEKKLNRATNYVEDDPSSSLIQLRAFAEDITNCVITYENLDLYKELDQIDKIKSLESKGIIDRVLAQKFHLIRKLGNAAVHNSHESKVDAENSLKQARQIYYWFQSRYIE